MPATRGLSRRYKQSVEGETHPEGPCPSPPLESRIEGEIPRLRGYLARLAGPSRGEVEDLVQECLARALRLRHSFDTERALWPWLRRTAERVAADHFSRAARSPEADPESVSERGAWPRDELADRDEAAALLARLSPLERDILTRFHVHGHPVARIARELQRPEGTIKSHLHRARKRLAAEAGNDD